MTQAVVCFSGGVDSLAALLKAKEHYSNNELMLLYMNIGSKYSSVEMKYARQLAQYMGHSLMISAHIHLRPWEHSDGHVPYRNVFITTYASMFLPEGGDIYLQNVQVGETSVGDRTNKFNQTLTLLLSLADQKRITIISPFEKQTKAGIIKYVKDNREDYMEILKKCYSCFSGEYTPCGNCGACIRYWYALRFNGIKVEDVIEYKTPIKETDLFQEYIDRLKNRVYTGERADMMKYVLDREKIQIG